MEQLPGRPHTCGPTWTLDAVTQVVGDVVNDVHQELEVVDVVHVDLIGVGGDGPQLVLIGVLYPWKTDGRSRSCEGGVLAGTAGLTDGVQLDAAVPQVLRVEDNIILGLSVGDQDSDFAGVWAHPNVGSEVVLEDIVQSHPCTSETNPQSLQLGTSHAELPARQHATDSQTEVALF